MRRGWGEGLLGWWVNHKIKMMITHTHTQQHTFMLGAIDKLAKHKKHQAEAW